MANVTKGTITFDGDAFVALSVDVRFSTMKDAAQMPVQGSLRSEITVVADMHDDTNVPYSILEKLFTSANVVTQDKIKPLKIELWKDENQEDVYCSYNGNAWISHFQTAMRPTSAAPGAEGALQSGWEVQDALILKFEAVMNQANFSEISMSN